MTKPSIGITLQQARAGRDTYWFVRLGTGIPIIFFVTTFVCGFMLSDYNHGSRLVSELGAIGTSSQYVFSSGLLICSGLSILFVIGLLRTSKALGISIVPVIVLLSYTISITGAAIFPLPMRLHGIMGMPSVLLILSPLLSLLLWNRSPHLLHSKQMSVLSLFVMSLGFLAFLPEILSDYAGLKQRLFHVGWSIWFLYLSYRFTKILENQKSVGLSSE